MEGTKRVRSINWTEQEKKVLRTLVLEKAHIIENKDTSTNTNSAKKLAWEEVMSGFNAINENKRDIAQLHNQWKSMKIKAKKTDFAFRRARNLTGGGPPPPSPPVEDRELIDAIPNEFAVDNNIYDSDTIYILQNERASELPESIQQSGRPEPISQSQRPEPFNQTERPEPKQPPKKKLRRNKLKSDCCCDENHEHQLLVLAKESRLETMQHERETHEYKMQCERETHEYKMQYEREMFERRLEIMSLEKEYWQAKLYKV